jgi:predicted alpha/beta-fold hydrolase
VFRRARFRPSADGARTREFRPFPLLKNPHVQTLLGHWLPGKRLRHPSRPHPVGLPDGDCVVLHDSLPDGWQPGDRIALLVHGLCGCHQSPGIQRLARLLLPQGVRVVRLDLRGCGDAAGLTRRLYHGGCSDDVRAAAAEVHSWVPRSPLVLAGVSLGGNIVLKLAGEAAERPVPGLAAVAAVAPPIDLERCATLLAQRRNRIYERHFLRGLVEQARQVRSLSGEPPVRFPRKLTLRLFDDLFTAPRHGFADALDYYRRSSSLPLLPRIAVPGLVMTARDDPFIAVEPFEELAPPAHLEVRILEHGGHLGFLGWDGAGGIRWAERRLAEWVARPPRLAAPVLG